MPSATCSGGCITWISGRCGISTCKYEKGKSLGIIGANGAGKSTLLKVISRVLHPTEGRAWTCGRIAPLLELGAGFHHELTGTGKHLPEWLAAWFFTPKEMENRFERIVDFAGLWDFIDVPIRTYSTGMVGRLGFSIASDANPDILLIDEILSVGDASLPTRPKNASQNFVPTDIAIVLVTHALEQDERNVHPRHLAGPWDALPGKAIPKPWWKCTGRALKTRSFQEPT